jgi:hypothetical protein
LLKYHENDSTRQKDKAITRTELMTIAPLQEFVLRTVLSHRLLLSAGLDGFSSASIRT